MSRNNAKTLFVTNFPYSIDEDSLKDLFEEFGTVKRATILRDADSGRSKGMGFVEFERFGVKDTGLLSLYDEYYPVHYTLDDVISQTDKQLFFGRTLYVKKATGKRTKRSNNGNQGNVSSSHGDGGYPYGSSTSRSRSSAQQASTQRTFTSIDKIVISECTICMCEIYYDENQPNGQQPCALICGHIFHFDCIKRWFEDGTSYQKTCGVCNQVTNQELKKLILTPEVPLIAANIEELEKAKREIIEFKEKVQQSTQRQNDDASTIRKLEEGKATLARKITQLDGQLKSEREASIKKLSEHHKSLQKIKSQHGGVLKKERDTISAQKETIDDLTLKQEAQLDTQRRLNEKLNNIAHVNTTVDKLLSTIDSLKQGEIDLKLDDKNQENEKKSIEKLNTQLIAKINKSLAIEQKDKSSWQSKSKKLENELNVSNQEISELQSKSNNLENGIKVLKKENNEWSTKYLEQNENEKRLEQRIENLTRDNLKLQDKLEHAKISNEATIRYKNYIQNLFDEERSQNYIQELKGPGPKY